MPTRILQTPWPPHPHHDAECAARYESLSCVGVELAGSDADLLNFGNSQARETLLGPALAWSIERYDAGHLCDDEEDARKKALAHTAELIRLAADCKVLRVTIAPAVVAGEMARRVDYNSALNRTTKSLASLLRVAERLGVKLCLRVGVCGFLTSPPELRELVDRLNSSALGVDLDAVSWPRGAPWEDWLRTLRSNIEVIGIPVPSDTNAILSAMEVATDGRPFAEDLVFRATGTPS